MKAKDIQPNTVYRGSVAGCWGYRSDWFILTGVAIEPEVSPHNRSPFGGSPRTHIKVQPLRSDRVTGLVQIGEPTLVRLQDIAEDQDFTFGEHLDHEVWRAGKRQEALREGH